LHDCTQNVRYITELTYANMTIVSLQSSTLSVLYLHSISLRRTTTNMRLQDDPTEAVAHDKRKIKQRKLNNVSCR